MRIDTSHSLPSLLMISDSLPDPEGGSRASRAWRLLCCAASTHEVSLSVHTDRPINLDQWRRASMLANRIHIETGRKSFFGSSKLLHGQSLKVIHEKFNAVLLTSPDLWQHQDGIVAEFRLCDFTVARETPMQSSNPSVGLLEKLTRGLLRASLPVSRSTVASGCDCLLVADAHQKERLPRGRSRANIIANHGPMEDWASMFRKLHMKQAPAMADFIAPEVKVMPIQPMTSRKAA